MNIETIDNSRATMNKHMGPYAENGGNFAAIYHRKLNYEEGTINEQKKVFKKLHQIFKQCQAEEKIGFSNLTNIAQKNIIFKRKNQALSTLFEAGFFKWDRDHYIQKIINKIDRIYNFQI